MLEEYVNLLAINIYNSVYNVDFMAKNLGVAEQALQSAKVFLNQHSAKHNQPQLFVVYVGKLAIEIYHRAGFNKEDYSQQIGDIYRSVSPNYKRDLRLAAEGGISLAEVGLSTAIDLLTCVGINSYDLRQFREKVTLGEKTGAARSELVQLLKNHTMLLAFDFNKWIWIIFRESSIFSNRVA